VKTTLTHSQFEIQLCIKILLIKASNQLQIKCQWCITPQRYHQSNTLETFCKVAINGNKWNRKKSCLTLFFKWQNNMLCCSKSAWSCCHCFCHCHLALHIVLMHLISTAGLMLALMQALAMAIAALRVLQTHQLGSPHLPEPLYPTENGLDPPCTAQSNWTSILPDDGNAHMPSWTPSCQPPALKQSFQFPSHETSYNHSLYLEQWLHHASIELQRGTYHGYCMCPPKFCYLLQCFSSWGRTPMNSTPTGKSLLLWRDFSVFIPGSLWPSPFLVVWKEFFLKCPLEGQRVFISCST